MDESNLYQTPEAPIIETEGDASCCGLNRTMFVLAIIGVFILIVLSALLTPVFKENQIIRYLPLVCFAGLVVAMGFRFKNQGSNPWLCLLALIPIVNLYIFGRCLVCPKGFADTKQLDGPGKVILWCYVGLILLNIVSSLSLLNI